MNREITLRIKPPSADLENQLLDVLRQQYQLTNIIRQRLDGESYIYLTMESKDANP